MEENSKILEEDLDESSSIYDLIADTRAVNLNRAQQNTLSRSMLLARHTYNDVLSYYISLERTFKTYYELNKKDKAKRKFVSKYDLYEELSRARNETEVNNIREPLHLLPKKALSLKDLPIMCLRMAANEARIAYFGCVKKWSNGIKTKSPKYRSFKDQQSLSFVSLPKYTISQNNTLKIKLSNLGNIEIRRVRNHGNTAQLRQIRFLKEGPYKPFRVQLIWRVNKNLEELNRIKQQKTSNIDAILQSISGLNENLTSLELLNASKNSNLNIIGLDWGLTHSWTRSDGVNTPKVGPTTLETSAIKAAQKRESYWRSIESKKKSSRAIKRALRQKLRARRQINSIISKVRNRRKTQASQHASFMIKTAIKLNQNINTAGTLPALIAVEKPKILMKMAQKPKKDSKTNKDKIDKNIIPVNEVISPIHIYSRHAMIRRRLYETGVVMRINPLKSKCEKLGIICLEVDPNNTTKMCPSCNLIKSKKLEQRIHKCPCGFKASRDQASAINIAARGLKELVNLKISELKIIDESLTKDTQKVGNVVILPEPNSVQNNLKSFEEIQKARMGAKMKIKASCDLHSIEGIISSLSAD